MFFKGYVQKSVMFSIYKALYKEETYPGSQSSSLVDAEVKVSRRAPNANSSKTYWFDNQLGCNETSETGLGQACKDYYELKPASFLVHRHSQAFASGTFQTTPMFACTCNFNREDLKIYT